MSIYNVKVYNYLLDQQIRIYSKPITKKDIEKDIIIEKEKEVKDKKQTAVEYKTEGQEIVSNKSYVHQVSVSRTIQKIYEITRSNMWKYFITLTFNPDKVDSFNYQEVTKKLSIWLNNLKKVYASDLKYIVVPELHKSGRYHFHGLIANTGNIQFIDSGKRTNTGDIIYNIGNYKLGFTTATEIKDCSKASSYITKYISKDLCAVTENKKRYWASRNLDKCVIDSYFLEPYEVKQMLEDMSENITYCKTTECSLNQRKTKYVEVTYS